MTHFYRHVYLSPHYDDAALSSGGSIHRQVQAGELALVITICAAPPETNEPLSPYAEAMHRTWSAPQAVVATRQTEDQAAMQILGANYLRLRFTDCIYRGQPRAEAWYYNNDDQLFGPVHPADQPLVADIVEAVLEMVPPGEKTILYAPLGVGHHADHQLAHLAARQLQAQGYPLVFYEDYPYADPIFAARYAHTLAATLADLPPPPLQPELRLLSTANLAAKIDSIRTYASQVPLLFGSEATMATIVRNYALHVGQGRLAERVWR
ncbi:MAG: PIG-L family deacetylase [Chloroflexota bacterium]